MFHNDMYSISPARKHQSMGYLRIDTATYVDDGETCQPQSGLLTPLSAACDGRRSSTASSNWSLISHDSASHAPSAASIWSSQEPVTSPPQGIHIDMSFIASDTSFEDISLSQDLNASKSIFDDTSGVLLGSPPDQVHFESHSQENWVNVLNQSSNQDLRLPFCTSDSMMPASGDLSAAFGTSLFQQHAAISDRNTEQENSCSGQWPLQSFTTSQPYQAGSTLTGQNGLCWPTPTSRSWLQTSINVDTSTIVPTEMDIDGHVISQMYNFSIRGIQADSSNSRSHQTMSESPQTTKAKKERKNSENEDLISLDSEIGSSLRSILKSTPGGKGLAKKERKHLTRSRRGNRHQMTDEYTGSLHGNAVDVRHMHNQKKKKFRCKFVDNAGKPCHAPFQREEHLKRHKAIHDGEKPFKCILPAAYKCDKYFNRRDNRRDHYKTHLSTTSSGRNARVKFDDLYQLLRDIEEPDEAEKTVRKLEKWKADGKHLK